MTPSPLVGVDPRPDLETGGEGRGGEERGGRRAAYNYNKPPREPISWIIKFLGRAGGGEVPRASQQVSRLGSH